MGVKEASSVYAVLEPSAVPVGYKQTEVGVIPEDWNQASLGTLADGIYRGASPRPIDDPVWFDGNSSIGWVRISDVTAAGRYLVDTLQHLSAEGVRNSRFVTAGSLIMSICATVGRPIETRVDVCIHDGFVVFDRPRGSQAFLFHVLRNLEPKWSAKGQTGSQMNLNTGLIKSTTVPVPSALLEQEAIAEALSDADALIDALSKLIAKKRQIKQGAMQALLTGKQRLPSFNGAWRATQLGAVSEFQVGFPFSSCGFNEDGRGVRVIRNRDLKSNDQFTWYDGKYPQDYLVDDGDLLVGMDGDFSPCVWSGGKALLNQRVGRLVPLDGLDPKYAFYRVVSELKLIEESTSGTTVKHLSHGEVERIELLLPSAEEQSAIAKVLSDMEAEITALEARLAKARQLKRGMMQQLLTGRIRLPLEQAA